MSDATLLCRVAVSVVNFLTLGVLLLLKLNAEALEMMGEEMTSMLTGLLFLVSSSVFTV